jgi:hypothetical protein
MISLLEKRPSILGLNIFLHNIAYHYLPTHTRYIINIIIMSAVAIPTEKIIKEIITETIEDESCKHEVASAASAITIIGKTSTDMGDPLKEDWKSIEIPMSINERRVSDMLVEYICTKLGSPLPSSVQPQKKYSVFGDASYRRTIRPHVETYKIGTIPLITRSIASAGAGGKTVSASASAREKIRETVEDGIIQKTIESLFTAFNMGKPSLERMNYGLNTQHYAEIVAVTFIYGIRYIISVHSTVFSDDMSKKDVYELVLGITKFIDYYSLETSKFTMVIDPVKKGSISALALADLKDALAELLTIIPYDGKKMFNLFPEIQFGTEYDGLIPTKAMEPRETQVKLIDTILDSINTGFFITDRAPVSSGKTTMAAVGIPTILRIWRGMGINKTLVYTCHNLAVMRTVGKLAVGSGMGIAFSQIITDPLTLEQSVKLFPQNAVKRGSTSLVLILAGPKVSFRLREEERKRPFKDRQFIFFTDECTEGSDELVIDPKNHALDGNVKLLANAQTHEIFASASMPSNDKIPLIMRYYATRYPDSAIVEISSTDIGIGCHIRTFAGNSFFPHTGCTTGEEIHKVIHAIRTNAFITRMYEHRTVQIFYDTMLSVGIADTTLPNINELFSLQRITMKNIVDFAVLLLEKLALQTTSVIKAVCAIPVDTIETYDVTSIRNNNSENIAERYYVPSDDPIATAHKDFGHYADHVLAEMKKIFGITDASRAIDAMVETYELKMKSNDEALQKLNDNAKMKKVERDVIHKSLIDERYATSLNFPNHFQIGTREFYSKYMKKHVGTQPRFFRTPISFETKHISSASYFNTSLSTTVDATTFILLLCGVGIYSHKLNKQYTNAVMQLAEQGCLAYLYVDQTLSYGTNIPVTSIIMTDIIDNYSIYFAFQTMGRTGREGKSVRSSAYIAPSKLPRFMEFIQNPDAPQFNIESANMENKFRELRPTLHDPVPIRVRPIETIVSVVKIEDADTTDHADSTIPCAGAGTRADTRADTSADTSVPTPELSWDDDGFVSCPPPVVPITTASPDEE